MGKNWVIKNKKGDFDAICREQGITEVTARLLVNRGIMTKEERDAYLHPSFANLHEAGLLKNAKAAATCLKEEIEQGNTIRIIGDYDVDGVVSVYILYRTLKAAGAKVDYRIPDRKKDGYGINTEMVKECIRDGIRVILTCDNGIAAMEPIAYARENNIKVVLTDHHEIPLFETEDGMEERMPEADIIVNPKQAGESTPYPKLCGAVVAYKVMLCLAEMTGLSQEFMKGFLPYAAMATVCDVMELCDENRSIVILGLQAMKQCNDVGICALLEENQLDKEHLSAYHFGFVLGPCLNASGRLDTAEKGLRLLLETDALKAAALAKEVTELNNIRKAMTQNYVQQARDYYESLEKLEPVLVHYIPECHESLTGIIAGRIREFFYRPTIVLTDGEEGCKGSGRSIDGYHMYEELCGCRELLTKFGGHPKAAGLSLPKENVEAFRQKLLSNCTLTEEQLCEKIAIDVVLPFGLVTEQVVEELKWLEPFGMGNEKPVFAERNLRVLQARILGKNANVLKLKLQNEYGKQFDTVFFGDISGFENELCRCYGAAELDKMYQGRENRVCFSMLYYPECNEFRGTITLQAVMQDYRFVV